MTDDPAGIVAAGPAPSGHGRRRLGRPGRASEAERPGGDVVQADMAELAFEAGSFDAIVSFYAVEHVPRERHGDLFRRCHAWLRPGGRLLFTVEARATHDAVGDWLGAPMFFSQFGPEETIELVREAGFAVENAEIEPQLEGGKEIEYLWVRARRRQ